MRLSSRTNSTFLLDTHLYPAYLDRNGTSCAVHPQASAPNPYTMGGGDLNMKKSWHPLLAVNQERVWKREKEAIEERKKLEELRREREQEREMQQLQRLQEEAGGKKRVDRVDWMYATPATTGSKSAAEMEDYLLGKKRVDKLLQGDEAEKVSKSSQQGPISLQNANSARDLAAKVREDPMLATKQQEQAAYEALLRDPARLRKLKAQAGIDVDAESKDERRRRKEEKRRRHEHESSSSSSRRRHRDNDDDDSHRRKESRHRDSHSESSRRRHHRHGDDAAVLRDRSPSRRGSERHSSRRHSPDRRREADRNRDSFRDDRRSFRYEERDRNGPAQSTRPRSRSRSRSRSGSPARERRAHDDRARHSQHVPRTTDDRRDRVSPRDRPDAMRPRNTEEDDARKEEVRLQRLREMEQNAKSMEQERSSYVRKINTEEAEQERREAELRQKLLDARTKGHGDGKGNFLLDQQRKTFGDSIDLSERMKRDRGRLQRFD